jgi:soluble lytic murein transglycosylase-like protein
MLKNFLPRTKAAFTSLLAALFISCFFVVAQHANAQAFLSATPDFSRLNAEISERAETALSRSLSSQQKPVAMQLDVDTQWIRDAPVVSPQRRVAQLQPALAPILEKYGVPVGFVAIVAVESGGDPLALSPKGARGLWQLMPQTARRYGLVVDTVRDERLDLEKSTTAAARYLRDLYVQFGSWPLALAAYNWGEQNLATAIQRTHSTNLALLSARKVLPAETRAYVPAVLARWIPEADRVVSNVASVRAVVYASQ